MAIETPVPPRALGQVTFTVFDDGNISVNVGGQLTMTHLCSVIGVANAFLGGKAYQGMTQSPGILVANGVLPNGVRQ